MDGSAVGAPRPGSSDPGTRPWLGFGLGLRTQHFEDLLRGPPTAVDWLEINSENFMVAGGKPRRYLEAFRQRWPIVMHGVSLNIGGTDPLDAAYLRALKQLARDVEPAWVSDHLCWTGVGGVNSHDLLPLPYSQEALAHVAARVRQVQDVLGRPLVLENLSSYVRFADSTLEEWEFLAELVRASGCKLLLDVNNIVVSAKNHDFDAGTFLAGIPAQAVWQIHLAGHGDYGDYAIDTHDHAVPEAVWALYEQAIARFGATSSMIERDDHIPPLPELLEELQRVRETHARGLAQIEAAKADGRWEAAYAPASKAEVPADLQAALDQSPEAAAFFATLTGSNRYAILYRIGAVKKRETRARKIAEFVAMLERHEKVHG